MRVYTYTHQYYVRERECVFWFLCVCMCEFQPLQPSNITIMMFYKKKVKNNGSLVTYTFTYHLNIHVYIWAPKYSNCEGLFRVCVRVYECACVETHIYVACVCMSVCTCVCVNECVCMSVCE